MKTQQPSCHTQGFINMDAHLATDVQADAELGSMGQTSHGQQVSEVGAGI